MVKDFYKEGQECSRLLETMEQHARLLTDISFSVIRTLAVTSGSVGSARRNLWIREWKAKAAEKTVLINIPFLRSYTVWLTVGHCDN